MLQTEKVNYVFDTYIPPIPKDSASQEAKDTYKTQKGDIDTSAYITVDIITPKFQKQHEMNCAPQGVVHK